MPGWGTQKRSLSTMASSIYCTVSDTKKSDQSVAISNNTNKT